MSPIDSILSLAAGSISNGPDRARMVTVFGAPFDHEGVKALATSIFQVMDAELRGRPFICGKTPTVADMAASAYIAHAPAGGLSQIGRAWCRERVCQYVESSR